MITIAVNRAALSHHPFKYLLNIAANCRRAKAYGRSPKNMRRYSERKNPNGVAFRFVCKVDALPNSGRAGRDRCLSHA
jgi:hypothetical protein